MFLLKGNREMKIKTLSDHSTPCWNCKAFDTYVEVFREYFHVFFIPVFPSGPKTVRLTCSECYSSIGNEPLKRHYEKTVRTPFYMYTVTLLVGGMIAVASLGGLYDSFQERQFIKSPKTGDIYLIHSKSQPLEGYYYEKVVAVNGDSVVRVPSSMQYLSRPTGSGRWVQYEERDTVRHTKQELLDMFKNDEIVGVSR